MAEVIKPMDSQGAAPPHVGCPVCGDMPDHCRDYTKGGETLVDTVPPSTTRLVTVGAPFYNQETSGSNWCLLQCPACGTYYDWDFEYEYLVNGSEDDINIRRLSADEGARKAALVAGHVAAARQRFAVESASRVETLLVSKDPREMKEAANWLFQSVNDGNDPAPVLADLLAAMRRAGTEGDASTSLNLVFFVYGSRNWESLERSRAAVAAAGAETQVLLGSTLRSCESSLRGN
jgi:hypothetical protein